MFKIKRIYENSENEDKYRVLVDRLWPRGISKERADINIWLKDIAPSNKLRKWYSHDINKWPEFKTKYLEEIQEKKDLIKQLNIMEKFNDTVTLLCSAKDEDHNNAVVLLELLNQPQKIIRTSVSRIHGS